MEQKKKKKEINKITNNMFPAAPLFQPRVVMNMAFVEYELSGEIHLNVSNPGGGHFATCYRLNVTPQLLR